MTYLFSHHGALENNTITTEDDLFIFLLHHARKHTLKAMYPKAIADFADEVIGALMAYRDLDDLKYPAPGEQSLLSRALHGVSAEMRPRHWELIEFATQVYETNGVDVEIANRLLIEILDLGGTNGRIYFEQIRENPEGSVGTRDVPCEHCPVPGGVRTGGEDPAAERVWGHPLGRQAGGASDEQGRSGPPTGGGAIVRHGMILSD